MTRLISVLLSVILMMQNPGPAVTGALANVSPPSPYTYSQYAYYPEDSSSLTSITSNSVTVSSGDFAFQFCRGNGTPSSVTGSSTPTATVNALPLTSWMSSGAYAEAFWYPSLSAGSTTFTCTPSVSSSYQAMAVVIYHYSGSGPVILSGSTTTGTCAQGTTCTTSSFSTSSAALVIDCTTIAAVITWRAGSIGSNTATLRAVSQNSFTTTNDMACEDTQFSLTQSSITATLNTSSYGLFGYTVAAFN